MVNIELLYGEEVIGNVTTNYDANGLFNTSLFAPSDKELVVQNSKLFQD